MKHSILTQIKRAKSTKGKKIKKKVHWCKQLEEIHVYTPESENTASDDLFLPSSQNSSSDLHQLPTTLQTVSTTGNRTCGLQQKLEKLSIDNAELTRFTVNNRPVWRKIVDAENSSLEGDEEWV